MFFQSEPSSGKSADEHPESFPRRTSKRERERERERQRETERDRMNWGQVTDEVTDSSIRSQEGLSPFLKQSVSSMHRERGRESKTKSSGREG